MKGYQWIIAGLVGVIASLVTLLAVDLLGGREARAQDTTQTGYVAVVAGPIVRNRVLPLIIVDTQALAIMTYDYEVTGNYRELVLTTVRSFKYDRKLIDYNHRDYSNPTRSDDTQRGDVSVQDVMRAIPRLRPLE